MASLLDQLFLPQRLLVRALDDLHRIADAAAAIGGFMRSERPVDSIREWMDVTAEALQSLRDQAAGVRSSVEPMPADLKTLRDEFGRADDEIARLREAFGPELAAFRRAADGILGEMGALRRSINALVRDADEISDVVEPLQAATERVGRVAERLPGGRRGT